MASGTEMARRNLQPSNDRFDSHGGGAAADDDDDLDYFDDEVDAVLEGWGQSFSNFAHDQSKLEHGSVNSSANNSIELSDISATPLLTLAQLTLSEPLASPAVNDTVHSDNTCEYNGVTCSCMTTNHHVDPSHQFRLTG